MKTICKNLSAMLLASVVLAGGPATAATAPTKSPTSKSTASATALTKAEIVAFNKDEMTLTVAGTKGEKDQVIQITSQTRIFRGLHHATTADLKVGQKISGSLKKGAAGKTDAVRLRLEESATDLKPADKPAAKSTKPAPKKP